MTDTNESLFARAARTPARFDGFERRNHTQNDGLRAYVADRITQICGLLATKFGIQDPMEAEIVARRMCDKRFAENHHFRLRGIYTRYKNLFCDWGNRIHSFSPSK